MLLLLDCAYVGTWKKKGGLTVADAFIAWVKSKAALLGSSIKFSCAKETHHDSGCVMEKYL